MDEKYSRERATPVIDDQNLEESLASSMLDLDFYLND